MCEAPREQDGPPRTIWQKEQTAVGFSGQERRQAPHWAHARQYLAVC